MAIIQNPIMGPIKNRVGNLVISKQWGRYILRSKPLKVKDPKTPAQEAHRACWRKMVKVLRQVNTFMNIAYAGLEIRMSAFAYVMRINMRDCFVAGTDEIDPSLFILCDNEGSFVKNIVLTSTVLNTITATFDSNTQNAEEDADPVKAYGFYADGDKIWQFGQEAIRNTGTITLYKIDMSGLNIAIYLECLDRVNLVNEQPKHVIKYVGMVNVI